MSSKEEELKKNQQNLEALLLNRRALSEALRNYWEVARRNEKRIDKFFRTEYGKGVLGMINTAVVSGNSDLLEHLVRTICDIMAQIGGGNTDLNMTIRRRASLFFDFYISKYKEHRSQIVTALVDAGYDFWAKDTFSLSQPSRFRQAITSVRSQDQFSLEFNHGKAQILLTGPTDLKSKQGPKKDEPVKATYPGSSVSKDEFLQNIATMTEEDFDPTDFLDETSVENMPNVLGELYTTFSMSENRSYRRLVADKKALSSFLKSVSHNKYTKDRALNMLFGFIYQALASKDKAFSIREKIRSAVARLVRADEGIFGPLGLQFSAIAGMSDGALRTTTSLPEITERPELDNFSRPRDKVEQQPAVSKPVTSQPPTTSEVTEKVASLGPIERLVKVFQSGYIDKAKLQHDYYVKHVANLLLTGVVEPDANLVKTSHREWQKLVHPDTAKDPIFAEISAPISKFVNCVVKEDFVREEGRPAILELLAVAAKLLCERSVLVVPKKGELELVLGGVTISVLLSRKKLNPKVVRVILDGQLIDRGDYNTINLEPNSVIELVLPIRPSRK